MSQAYARDTDGGIKLSFVTSSHIFTLQKWQDYILVWKTIGSVTSFTIYSCCSGKSKPMSFVFPLSVPHFKLLEI